MDTDRLGRLQWAGGAAIVLGCLVLGLFLVFEARSDCTQYKAAGEALSHHHVATRLTHAISAERAMSALSAIDPNPDTARTIVTRRDRTDAELGVFKQMLVASFGAQGELQALMQRLEDRLGNARDTVNGVIALPIDQRANSHVADVIGAMFAVCDIMSGLRDKIGQAVIKSSPDVTSDILLVTTASALREQGGRLGASVVLYLAPSEKELERGAVREFDEAIGRIAVLLSSLTGVLGPAFGDADVERAASEMQNLFVATSVPLATQIVRGEAKAVYTSKSFADAFIPGLYAIEKVFEAIANASRRKIEAKRDAAYRKTVQAAIPTGAMLVISLAVVSIFRRRVFQPLAGAQEQIEAIARGDLAHASFKSKVASELQSLFPGLALVRDNQLQLERDQQRISDQFDRLSETDQLTGCLNRVAFLRRAKRVVEAANAKEIALAIVVFDIDELKWVNSAGGYVAGDETLKKTATELGHYIGEGDLFARYGGDEFAMLFAARDRYSALATAEAMRRHIEKSLVTFGGTKTTASFGMAFRACDSGLGLEQLMATAERRLVAAKAHGRNCVCAGDDDAPATATLPLGKPRNRPRNDRAQAARSTRR
ncbi:putative diguanylate cyclase YdaM [Variibacter gotjawalensis]|uniref:diguanylate cyclase n=1 Tax=Variibacter gotjawalensis TaxID=1333996 RepID=A0A0S3PVJ7_9BRAD|nr:GGDEF domain-containing protein [Variibacter gotjawalensis]NIK45800.1 diguanylate cyclase (GGDEF)-like protein [Variibacter gotjawalensis]RZS47724.1 diguanylate cyclase (GGDEF)-like protein [Variibacter gotjawalensis]BAT59978.1 putative diguanylate cyclase YdaM [Variibacter gotjawalensis]